jgi:hypothetical protein
MEPKFKFHLSHEVTDTTYGIIVLSTRNKRTICIINVLDGPEEMIMNVLFVESIAIVTTDIFPGSSGVNSSGSLKACSYEVVSWG